ncbi:MAG: helix-turn-helix domain-containing protein [Cohaesibacter sp.]|nr:helix-turn-helix domain-containing protein [Cohaesibacter sp.]
MDEQSNTEHFDLEEQLKALSNPHRLRILEWLKEPTAHFPTQQDADLIDDGVCVGFLTEKAELSQPTVTSHMQKLSKAGFVKSKKIKNWVYYRLDPNQIDAFLSNLKIRIADKI